MNITWADVKEAFFVIGSIAGVFAFLRPVVEGKFARDLKRMEHITLLINEGALVDLEELVCRMGPVPDESLHPFTQLSHERDTNQDAVRFTGPLAEHLTRELDRLITAYHGLREYVQVDEWEPRMHMRADGSQYGSWDFNKEAFAKKTGYPTGYAEHLAGAAAKAAEMRKAFQRLQLVAELHFFETPFASWLLERRFKAHGL